MSGAATNYGVCIAGTGSYLPETILTNEDLAKRVDTSDEWIFTRTGIRARRIAAAGEFTSHMATAAARKALEQAGLEPSEIKLIIVATITPDTLTPATACYVQQQLGAMNAVAFDISAACSGFLYAMKICKRLIADGAFENALIIGAEKLSAFVNWEDRSTCVLFGDGAGAAVLRRANPGEGEILATEMGTDGNLTHLLNIPGGGSACPITSENVGTHLATLAMQGKDRTRRAEGGGHRLRHSSPSEPPNYRCHCRSPFRPRRSRFRESRQIRQYLCGCRSDRIGRSRPLGSF